MSDGELRIANYLNSLDTEGLSPEQVRSVIYAECMNRGDGAGKESAYRALSRPVPSVEVIARTICEADGDCPCAVSCHKEGDIFHTMATAIRNLLTGEA